MEKSYEYQKWLKLPLDRFQLWTYMLVEFK